MMVSTLRVVSHTLSQCEDGPLEVEATLFGTTSTGSVQTTTAKEAKGRLSRLGLTPALAMQALSSMNREVLASYAQASCVRAVLPLLGPGEIFAGRTYDRDNLSYDGTWIDLRSLASDLGVPSVGLVLQGLYLASVLDEMSPETQLQLENGGSGKVAHMALLKPHAVISVLSRLVPRSPRTQRGEEQNFRHEIVRALRDGAMVATPSSRRRHVAIEQALDAHGPKFASVQPAPIYVVGTSAKVEPIAAIKEPVASPKEPVAAPKELVATVLRPIPVAEPSVEVLLNFHDDEPASGEGPVSMEDFPAPRAILELVPGPQAYAGMREDEAPAAAAFVMPMRPELQAPIDRGHMTDRPPPARPSGMHRESGRVRYVPEEVESLSLPDDENQVRVVSTRFGRMLGAEYRELYGVRLRTDAQAVEWMQRHLVSRWGESGPIGPEAALDVRRHGALLSEILARTLGAEWVDVGPTEIGYWAMFVPPRTRTWPFGRVHRFLTLGHQEKDLVSYYLGLVARAREGG